MKRSTDPLPQPFAALVETIRANHPDMGGDNRAAVAELQARLALAQDRTASRLTLATWALVLATIGLIVVAVLG